MQTSLSQLSLVPLQRFSFNFIANLVATLYMFVGSNRALYWVKPTIWQFFLFANIALASNFLFAWLSAESGSQFNEQGFISYLVWPTVMLLGGIILVRRYQNGMLLLVPATLWLVADSMSALLQSAMQFFGHLDWLPQPAYMVLPAIFSVLFIWQTLSLLWVFSKHLRWSWLERVVITFGAFVILTVWQQNVRSQPIFKPIVVEPTIDEQVFYQQPILLDESLITLKQNRVQQADWYFLGVAGFAGQDVFRSEIEKTKELFDVRFGTTGRSLALINNQNTMLTRPIASKTGLLKSLQAMANLMNLDEDVLFLAISSHGGEQVVEMNNPPLALENLDATWLKNTLDDVGIKWRVIVVSACYSGSFIDVLKSPTTLIITASRHDKPSFGCTNEAEYTYFGQAFFAESLRRHDNFFDAFQDAVVSVTKREKDLGFEPSEPQWVIGSAMKSRLPVLEKSLFYSPVQLPVEALDDKQSMPPQEIQAVQ